MARVFVCSDIFGDDKDDIQSFIRLLFHLNQIDLRGVSVSYYAAHNHHQNLIDLVEDHLATDMALLTAMDSNYPTAATVSALIHKGKAGTGAPTGGADTAGSNALIAAALAASPSDPLWVLNWGMFGDLAQALYDDPSILPNIRVYGIAPTAGYNYTSDALAADYLIDNMVPGQPLDDLWFIANDSSFRGMYCGASGENVPDRQFAPRYAWGRGAMGDFYGDACWASDFSSAGYKEGDTPSLLYVIDNVLANGTGDDPADAGGGWGGRFEKDATKGNNYWRDIQSGQTLGSYPGANTIRIHQSDIKADLAAKFALLANPTVTDCETFSDITANDTTVAGRNPVPLGGAWQNWRSDRPMDVINNNQQDYVTGTSSSTSVHFLNNTPAAPEYTVEAVCWFTSNVNYGGLMINANGTLAGSNTTWHSFFLEGGSPYPWRLNRFIQASAIDTGIDEAQGDTISISTNEPARYRITRTDNGDGTAKHRTWIRKISGGGWVLVHDETESSPGSFPVGKPGIRGNNAFRVGALVARSNASPPLVPALLTNTQTFYAPTVSPGEVSLAPSLLSNTSTFYAPTISVGVATLSPPLLTNGQTFFAATVSVGTVDLAPTLLTNTSTFYAPTVTPGAVTLSPPLLTNTATFFSPTVTAESGTQTLTPDLFTNDNSFYGPTVSPGAVTLSPSLLTDGETFYAPTVTVGAVTLTPSLFTNSNTFYGPTVSLEGAPQTLTPSLFANDNVFYAPTVTPGAVELAATLLTNGSSFFAPTVTVGAVTLSPALVANDNVFYAATVEIAGGQRVATVGRGTRRPPNISTGGRPAAISRGVR